MKATHRIQASVEMVLHTVMINDLKLKPEQIGSAVCTVVENFDDLIRLVQKHDPDRAELEVSRYILGILRAEELAGTKTAN